MSRSRPVRWTRRAEYLFTVVVTLGAAAAVSVFLLILPAGGVR